MGKPQDNYELFEYLLTQLPPLPERKLKSIQVDIQCGQPEGAIARLLGWCEDNKVILDDELKKLIREVIVIDGWGSNDYETEDVLRSVR